MLDIIHVKILKRKNTLKGVLWSIIHGSVCLCLKMYAYLHARSKPFNEIH